jgi:hypothetical protein
MACARIAISTEPDNTEMFDKLPHIGFKLLLKDHTDLLVHENVVIFKCELFAGMMRFGGIETTQKSVDFTQEETSTKNIRQFFKLLYGFKLELNVEDFINVWILASKYCYKKLHIVEDVLINQIDSMSAEQILTVLNFDVKGQLTERIISKIPLKLFVPLGESIDDPIILRLFISESLKRYKKLGEEVKDGFKKSPNNNVKNPSGEKDKSIEELFGMMNSPFSFARTSKQ